MSDPLLQHLTPGRDDCTCCTGHANAALHVKPLYHPLRRPQHTGHQRHIARLQQAALQLVVPHRAPLHPARMAARQCIKAIGQHGHQASVPSPALQQVGSRARSPGPIGEIRIGHDQLGPPLVCCPLQEMQHMVIECGSPLEPAFAWRSCSCHWSRCGAGYGWWRQRLLHVRHGECVIQRPRGPSRLRTTATAATVRRRWPHSHRVDQGGVYRQVSSSG